MINKNFRLDSTEFLKAVTWCMENGFEGELFPCFDGLQYCYPRKKGKEFDFICHSCSYGGNEGLLEILSDKKDDVVGCLTAEELIDLIIQLYT